MKSFKPISFEDRLAAQAEAKKAMLEKFKPKPAAREKPYVDTAAQRQEAEAKEREAQAANKAANARAALLAMYGTKKRGSGSK